MNTVNFMPMTLRSQKFKYKYGTNIYRLYRVSIENFSLRCKLEQKNTMCKFSPI